MRRLGQATSATRFLGGGAMSSDGYPYRYRSTTEGASRANAACWSIAVLQLDELSIDHEASVGPRSATRPGSRIVWAQGVGNDGDAALECWVAAGRPPSGRARCPKALRKEASLRQVVAFLIHWLLVRVQDGPPDDSEELGCICPTPSGARLASVSTSVSRIPARRAAASELCT